MDSSPCGHCHQIKPEAEFHRRRASPNGLQRNCKLCQRQLVNARRATAEGKQVRLAYVARNKLRIQAYNCEWNRHHAPPRAKRTSSAEKREYHRTYRLAHMDRYRGYARKYYWRNVERERERARIREYEKYHKNKAAAA